MHARQLAALELADSPGIEWTGKHWSVPSQTDRAQYRVDAKVSFCTCEDHELTGKECKHMLAVLHVMRRKAGIVIPERTAEPDQPPKKRRTYRQDWPKYNAAQTNEKRLFLHLLSDWALLRTNSPEPDEYARWLLLQRSVSDPTEVAYFACGSPPDATLPQLVGVAGARWAIEDLFELAKGDCGLDEYEGRGWTGWHRHVTLSLWALAVVAVIRSRVPAPRRKKGASG